MAKADIKMPDELLTKLDGLGKHFDSVAKTVLKAGGEVILERTKDNLELVIGKGTKYESRSTGELIRSLGISNVKLDRQGIFNVKVGFSEPRHSGKSNAGLANIIEYGKSGQSAKPFLKPAKTAARKKCIDVMKETLEREVGKL